MTKNQRPIFHLFTSTIFVLGFTASLINQEHLMAQGTVSASKTTERFEFPGMTVDRKQRIVDLSATVCMTSGPLELIACSQGTKEHESIVAIKARPHYVHLGLLMIGMRNGRPAVRQMIERPDAKSTWIDLPPLGERICVSLLIKNAEGKQVERDIADFVTKAQTPPSDQEKFPSTFLFAGSHIIPGQSEKENNNAQVAAPGQYLADLQGNVISISTFGDEVLCLPWSDSGTALDFHSRNNGSLVWHANSDALPKIGTQVILRLRPYVSSDEADEFKPQIIKPSRDK